VCPLIKGLATQQRRFAGSWLNCTRNVNCEALLTGIAFAKPTHRFSRDRNAQIQKQSADDLKGGTLVPELVDLHPKRLQSVNFEPRSFLKVLHGLLKFLRRVRLHDSTGQGS
jgi:hypothetical protein